MSCQLLTQSPMSR